MLRLFKTEPYESNANWKNKWLDYNGCILSIPVRDWNNIKRGLWWRMLKRWYGKWYGMMEVGERDDDGDARILVDQWQKLRWHGWCRTELCVWALWRGICWRTRFWRCMRPRPRWRRSMRALALWTRLAWVTLARGTTWHADPRTNRVGTGAGVDSDILLTLSAMLAVLSSRLDEET